MIFYSALKIIVCSISADDCFYLKDTNNNYVNVSSSGVKLSGDKCVLKAEKHSLGGYTFTSNNQSMNNSDNKTNTKEKDTDSPTTNMKITKEGSYVKITYDSNSCATVDGISVIFTDCEKNNKKQQFTVEKVDCEKSKDLKDSSKTDSKNKSASDSSKTTTKDSSKTSADSSKTTSSKDNTKSADSSSSKSANNSNSSNPKTDNIEPNKSTSGNSDNSSKSTTNDKDKASSAENSSNSSKSDKDSNNSSTVPKSATVNYSTAESKNTKSKSNTSDGDISDESSTTSNSSAPKSTFYTVKQNKNVSVKTTDIIYPSSKSATPTSSNLGTYQKI